MGGVADQQHPAPVPAPELDLVGGGRVHPVERGEHLPAGADRHHEKAAAATEQGRPLVDRRTVPDDAAVDHLPGRAGWAAERGQRPDRGTRPVGTDHQVVLGLGAVDEGDADGGRQQLDGAYLRAVPDRAAGTAEQHPVQVGSGQRAALADPGPECVEVDLAQRRTGRVEEPLPVDDLPVRADGVVEVQPAQRAGRVAGQVQAGVGEVVRRRPVRSGRKPARRSARATASPAMPAPTTRMRRGEPRMGVYASGGGSARVEGKRLLGAIGTHQRQPAHLRHPSAAADPPVGTGHQPAGVGGCPIVRPRHTSQLTPIAPSGCA